MVVIMGKNEAALRTMRDTMKPQDKVPISHNFYSETPEKHSSKKSSNSFKKDAKKKKK